MSHIHGSNSQRFRSYEFLKYSKQIRKKGSIVHLLRYVVKRSYKFTVQQSTKLLEVSSICLDTFSDSCDQRTSNLRLEVLWSFWTFLTQN
jgi:hypothetical protein